VRLSCLNCLFLKNYKHFIAQLRSLQILKFILMLLNNTRATTTQTSIDVLLLVAKKFHQQRANFIKRISMYSLLLP